MGQSDHDKSQQAEVLVAASLLRLGSDTKAARLFKELRLGDANSPQPFDALTRLADALGLGGAERHARLTEARARAQMATAAAAVQRLTVLSALSRSYPHLLSQIPDPPIALWVRGGVDSLRLDGVAIVGSRYASAAGLATARRLGQELAEVGLAVISGLARGIDGAAHQGALDASGRTVAVLGNGLDVTYPAEHAALARAISVDGAVVSEFPPGTRPHASHFPLRNRIISGLSRAVVVVEASEKSGSLITARAALEQGRDVLAVPGNVASGRYRGGHALIKDGARLVETVDDIIEELGWSPAGHSTSSHLLKSLQDSGLEAVIQPGETLDLDELAARTGRQSSDLLAELGTLEVAGRVRRFPGGGFARLDGPDTNRQR